MNHTILIGPAGSGRTVWARDLASRIELSSEQRDEMYAMYHLARLPSGFVPTKTPFRAPHHTCSTAALRGQITASGRIRPGEISLARHGVLFLDDATEFRREALDTIARAIDTEPAPFTLVLAIAPCACRPYTVCGCEGADRQRHQKRLPYALWAACDVVEAVPNESGRGFTWRRASGR